MRFESRFGRGIIVAACVLACAAVSAVPASASFGVGAKLTLRVNRQTDRFHGRVRSPRDECVVGRKVLLIRRHHHHNHRLAHTFASESGKYRVRIPGQEGHKIFAKILRTHTPEGTVCKGVRTPTVTA